MLKYNNSKSDKWIIFHIVFVFIGINTCIVLNFLLLYGFFPFAVFVLILLCDPQWKSQKLSRVLTCERVIFSP